MNPLQERSAFADQEESQREPAQSQSSYVLQDKNVESQYANSLGRASPTNNNRPQEKTEYEKMIEAQMAMYPGGFMEDSADLGDIGNIAASGDAPSDGAYQ